ncbi:hypothetical protein KIH39_24795 [Telmatocola sphagniphila]|jgi:hypothetical protein|uniref:Flippase-like domain-containing protein n=1 Tax=Telmatocola sphagniphila TaxID=1123043 RepID=A0A8E6B7U8_9BACT|nr:lysylphosphatidylglycerol synthase domain-containing protein [Telmatocola sphagniphila]QVL32015.1 hypothetical protein KIH39_24795 [Telmatocola sphagniphila]
MNKGRRLARIFIQWVLPIAVLIAIAWQFVSILSRPEVREQIDKLQLRWYWLVGSGILYLCAHTIWANFWTRLLTQQGLPTSQATGITAYFISQLGKYIPGKIWVILIRVTMLGTSGKSRTIVAVTATFEALTSMATGGFIAALLLPLLSLDLTKFGAKNSSLVAIALLPVGLVFLNRLIYVMVKRQSQSGETDIPLMSFRTMLLGILQAAVGWLFLGLSLWMTMQAILPEFRALELEELGRLTAINAIAYVIGFIFLFMPAGAGIREDVMKGLLTPELAGNFGEGAAGVALYIALILRLVWTTAEILLVGLLYLRKKKLGSVPVPVTPSLQEQAA